MSFPKLKTVIKSLESARAKYVKEFGVEPVVWSFNGDECKVTLTDKVKRTDHGTTSGPDKMKEYDIVLPNIW